MAAGGGGGGRGGGLKKGCRKVTKKQKARGEHDVEQKWKEEEQQL